jgi:CheY-like chemotaxis protein
LAKKSVTPPAADEGGSPSAETEQTKVPGLSILLVEDHEPTRAALARLLTRRGHQIKTATCVTEALTIADTYEFQLLMSDIGLPDGNGFELMKALVQKNSGLQGIALTGYGMEQEVEKSREAGFEIHLTKPIRVQSLATALAAIASLARSR